MKPIIHWHNAIALTSLLSLTLSGLAGGIAAATPPKPQEAISSARQSSVSQERGEFQLAQVMNDCRQVVEQGGIVVRQKPWADSPIVGNIDNYERVSIDGPGANGWVPISSPHEGYIPSRYLTYCQETVSPPINDCREVSGMRLDVHSAPSTDSPVVGTIEFREQVAIENRGEDGWVPIYAPFNGFVSADRLKLCY